MSIGSLSIKDPQPEASQDFCVYLHRRSTDGRVFYVGKGTRKRANFFHDRNQYWQKTAKKHGVEVEIVFDGLCESDAFEEERNVIAELRYFGEPLTNMTDGGEGSTGYKFSEEVVSARRELMTRKNPMHDPAIKAKSILNNYTPERRAELSDRLKRNNPMNDVDIRAKVSATQQKRLSDPDVKAKHGSTMRKVWASQDLRDRLSETQSERLKDPKNKQMQRDITTQLWNDAAFREKTTSAMKKAWSKPELKKKKSDAMKKVFANPEFRAKAQKARAIIKNQVQCSNGMVFDGAGDATRWLASVRGEGKTIRTSAIHAVCRNERSIAYGFGWKYTRHEA